MKQLNIIIKAVQEIDDLQGPTRGVRATIKKVILATM